MTVLQLSVTVQRGGTVTAASPDLPARLDTDEFVADPHRVFAALRDSAPVVPVVINGGIPAWLVTRYDVAKRTLTDPRLAKGAEHWRAFNAGEIPFTGDVAVAARRNILSTDPPEHTRLRSALASALTPRRVEEMRPWITRIVTDLLDTIAPKGSADLAAEFALPIPMTVICELFTVPDQHRPQIRAWTETLFHGADLQRMKQASEEIDALLGEVVDARRADPGGDFTSTLIRAEDSGRLSRPELIQLLRAMLAGGNETTINLLCNAIAALLRNPDQLALLVERPDRWPDAIEEVLRWEGPIQNSIWRFAAADLEIDGVRIPRGDAVIVGLAAADRDERRFAAPDTFDIGRTDRQHLAFGRGVHHCIGASLARLEARIALPMLFERLPDLRFAQPYEQLRYRRSTMSRSLVALPVDFTPHPPAAEEPAP
jgi:cytochrome P450